MTLAETQALFHRAVVGEPIAPEQLEACFAGTAAMPAARRVAVYADMYRWRLADALRATYPMLARLLGDERFAELAERYLRRHPSDHHDIGRVGRLLPEFLAGDPGAERPDLPDLAALEWVRQEVFFAPAAAPVEAALLVGIDADTFAGLTLRLSPALRLLRPGHDLVVLWRRLEEELPPEPPRPAPGAVAVWRAGFEAVHAALSAEEAAALDAALTGAPLGAVCAHFAAVSHPAAAAHAALSSWLAEGWVVGVDPPGRYGSSRASSPPVVV